MCMYNWRWDTWQLEPRTKRDWGEGLQMVAGYSRVWSSVSNCFLYRLNEVLTANLRLWDCYLLWGHNHMAEIKLQKAPGSLPNTPRQAWPLAERTYLGVVWTSLPVGCSCKAPVRCRPAIAARRCWTSSAIPLCLTYRPGRLHSRNPLQPPPTPIQLQAASAAPLPPRRKGWTSSQSHSGRSEMGAAWSDRKLAAESTLDRSSYHPNI